MYKVRWEGSLIPILFDPDSLLVLFKVAFAKHCTTSSFLIKLFMVPLSILFGKT